MRRASGVARRASGVARRASGVARRASRVIAHASLKRLLLVEIKGPVFLYTTLRVHEKVSPIKFSKANMSSSRTLRS